MTLACPEGWEARLAIVNASLEPLVARLAAEMRREDGDARRGVGSVAVDRHTYWTNLYGKREGSRIAQLPDEDRAREGFVQNERNGYASRHRLDARAIADEMLSQIAGREPVRELDVGTLLAAYETLRAQRVDFVRVRAALDERDELERRLSDAQPSPEDVFGAHVAA